MAEASDAQGILRQNLLDAGCGPDTVQRCMDLVKKRIDCLVHHYE